MDHIDFCTALKRLLSILNMDEEFSFSYFMKAIKVLLFLFIFD